LFQNQIVLNDFMRIPRIYLPNILSTNHTVYLDENAVRHVVKVLRLKKGAPLILFNGKGGEYQAVLEAVDKKQVLVRLGEYVEREVESNLDIVLAQGVSRGERMDYTIQKAVELGVKKIIPLFMIRTVVNLDERRMIKRVQHWQQIAINACEQCGRNQVPEVHDIQDYRHWLDEPPAGGKFILHHAAAKRLSDVRECNNPVTLLAGPEGGFSNEEISLAKKVGFIPLRLGPRILRTETAALVALSLLQMRWGDLD
jgi:16S rRNA (uracil1498-N3)-methyltransferase